MVITEMLTTFLNSAINFTPKLIGAIILLLIGWLVGLVVGRVIQELLRRLKIDEYVARGKRPIFKISNIFSVIFTWAIYLIFIQAAVETLGIPALVTVVGAILAFLPGLIEGIIIVIAGYALAEYVRRQIEASEVTYSGIISKVLFFLIIYIAIAMALPLVGIDPFLINAILLVIVGAVGLGLAIAIGFGLKDVVAQMAKKYQKKLR